MWPLERSDKTMGPRLRRSEAGPRAAAEQLWARFVASGIRTANLCRLFRRIGSTAAVGLAVASCVSTPNGQWRDPPTSVVDRDVLRRLGLDPHLHEVLELKTSINCFDGYVVGMEESDHRLVGWPRYWSPSQGPDVEPCSANSGFCLELQRCSGTSASSASGMAPCIEEMQDRLNPSWLLKPIGLARTPFVSHIVKFPPAAGPPPGLLYEILTSCGTLVDPARATCRARSGDNYYTLGFDALTETLAANLRMQVEGTSEDKPTHFVVMTAGWHATQVQALKDFSRLLRSIRDAAGGMPFRPVPILLTWDSFFRNPLGAAFLDLTNNAGDADEIGATWANVLIEKVLLPLKRENGIPIVLIGHSFGARLLTRAADSGVLLRRDAQVSAAGKQPAIDVLIGLQAAMSLERLLPGNVRSFSHLRREVGAAVFTTSQFDRAVRWPGLLGVTYVGSSAAFGVATNRSRPVLETASVDEQGLLVQEVGGPASWMRYCDEGKITLVNADEMIRKSAGLLRGAHDDVYSVSVGRMIWNILAACAPGRLQRAVK